MKNINEKLRIEQLDRKMKAFLKNSPIPSSVGWIFVTRTALGMSLEQLGKKMGMTAQSVREMELREKDGTISLKSLKQAAKAFGLGLSYGFYPVEANLDKMVKKRSQEVAEKIVLRTHRTMQLENQANTKARIRKSIKEMQANLLRSNLKSLWD